MRSQHTKPRPRISMLCLNCGDSFLAKPSDIERGNGKYCSRLCYLGRNGSTVDRFWRLVDKNGPIPSHRTELGSCWLWTGSRDSNGYGWASDGVRQRHIRAHRLSYILHYGDFPSEAPHALHKCDNPPCVRPAHLFPGTREDNMKDMVAKKRWRNGYSA